MQKLYEEPAVNGLERNRDRGSAIEKAIRVLDAVTEQPQSIGLPDIAARVGLPRQTVHRILAQLQEIGLVTRGPARDRYLVGPKLSKLALAALLSKNQNTPVRMVLQALAEEVRETCNLGVLDGLSFCNLDRVEYDWPLRVHVEPGSRVPAHCVAGGKVLLAYLPDRVRARILASARLKPMTEKSITDVGQLEACLQTVREDAYVVSVEEFALGSIAVGVPIFDSRGRVPAALAMHAAGSRLSEDKARSFVPRLQEAAAELASIWQI